MARSEEGKRKLKENHAANAALAFYVERQGRPWISIRAHLPRVMAELGLGDTWSRRKKATLACLAVLQERGCLPPPGYIPPWKRQDGWMAMEQERERRAW